MKKKFTLKKGIYIFLGLLLAAALIVGINYLITSNSKESEAFLTKKPEVKNMEDKKKQEFCEWICTNGIREDFKNFEVIFKIIEDCQENKI